MSISPNQAVRTNRSKVLTVGRRVILGTRGRRRYTNGHDVFHCAPNSRAVFEAM
jgi:hypothetical protein